MKYSKYSFIDKKDFILYYLKENGKIIVIYADGRRENLIYTKENEIKILDIMKNQIIQYVSTNKTGLTLEDEKAMMNKGFVGMLNLYLSLCIGYTISENGLKFLMLSLFAGVGISLIVSNISDNIQLKKLNDEAKKYKLFLDNEHLINKNLNKDVLTNLNSTAQFMIQQDNEINVNTLENIKTKQLKKLVKSIKK